MGSTSNPNPWAPYDSYSDCSQGICNVYCPQWCYLIFPPPPPSFLDEDSSSSSSFSPLLIALIGILASAFLLVSYYTLISKYCHRRRQNPSEALGYVFSSATESRRVISNSAGDGLNDSLIKSITVYKYRRGDGFVDCSDCSVCLSEFEDNESLRLLPKCNHAFHLPCIDTWLKSHSNCPLCRAFVTGIDSTAKTVAVSNQPNQIDIESINQGGQTIEMNSTVVGDLEHRTGDSVVVIRELEIGSRNINIRTEEQRDAKDENPQPIRRSVSLNSGIAVSITDVLRDIKDYERDEEGSAGVGTSQQRREVEDAKTLTSTASQRSGVSSFMVRSSVAMKRSASTGRFIFSRYDQPRNYHLPN